MKKAKQRLINKITCSKAFTLAEALVAILILLMVTAIVAAGIPSAANAYDKVVIASNAEVLMSTTMSALRNELSTAKDIRIAVDSSGHEINGISYYNSSSDSRSKIYCTDSDIMYERYAVDEQLGNKGSDPERLISEAASDKEKELHVSFTGVSYSNGVVTFSGLAVKKKNGDETPAVRGTYSVRIITE